MNKKFHNFLIEIKEGRKKGKKQEGRKGGKKGGKEEAINLIKY